MDHWLEDAVLQTGLVTIEQLDAMARWPSFEALPFAERLYRSGLVTDAAMVDLFVKQGAEDATPLLEDKPPPPAALGALSRSLAARFHAIPLAVNRSRVVVGMLDPSDTHALEEMAFYTGLSVEPRVVRGGVLFPALALAYGVPEVRVDEGFVAQHGKRPPLAVLRPADEEIDDTLPPPFEDLPAVRIRPPAPKAADPSRSPLAAGIVRAAGDDIPQSPTESGRFLFSRFGAALEDGPLASAGVLDDAPPSSPKVPAPEVPSPPPKVERDLVGRDSLPPQVLPLLVPTFRTAAFFLVRKDVAVGWDGRAPGLSRDDFRGILLPLTAPSAFQRAWSWRMVAAGTSDRPTTTERIFFRFLKMKPPSTFAVLPILVGDDPVALLYVDRDEGPLDEPLIASARQVGVTLADGLAPLVASGSLFGPSPR